MVAEVAHRCTEVESGARNVDNILANTLLPEVSRLLLEQIDEGGRLTAIWVGVAANGAFEYQAEMNTGEREARRQVTVVG